MSLTVGNVTFGQGRPKICVPLTGKDRQALLEEAAAAQALPAEVLEWRADLYHGDRLALLPALRQAAGEKLLLVTLRTLGEGGAADLGGDEYDAFCLAAAQSGCADLVDVELRRGAEALSDLLPALKAAGVRVILSSHEWEQTPESGVMLSRLQEMADLGGDLRKLAVTPKNAEDVLRLLRVTRRAASEDPDRPVITMAMGALGSVTRICGEVFGSAMTFGAGARASAPGQLPAGTLLTCLEALRLD